MQENRKLVGGFAERLKAAVEKAGGVPVVIHSAFPAVDQASLYTWMSGKREPSLVKLTPLARALNVSLDWLIMGADEQRPAVNSAPPRVGIRGGIEVETLAEILSIAEGEPFWRRLSVEERARRAARTYVQLLADGKTISRARVIRIMRVA